MKKYTKSEFDKMFKEFYSRKDKMFEEFYSRKNKNGEPEFYEEWVTGGECGGSCWDNEFSSRPVSAEREPNSWGLTKFLVKYFSKIGFLEYNEINERYVERGEYSVNEYYGNYTDYGYKSITKTKLYDALKEFGYVE